MYVFFKLTFIDKKIWITLLERYHFIKDYQYKRNGHYHSIFGIPNTDLKWPDTTKKNSEFKVEKERESIEKVYSWLQNKFDKCYFRWAKLH